MEYFNCLKHKAFKIKDSKKRRHPRMDPDMEGYDYIISPPRLDFEAILESKAIRRLRHKAQVFPTPENEHIRTRDMILRKQLPWDTISDIRLLDISAKIYYQ